MAILCNNGCLSPAQLAANYEDFCDPVRRKSGWPHLIFVPCGANFDPSSAAAWASNGVITPKGKVTLSSPTVNETEEFSTCGEKEVMDTTFTLDFQTFAGSLDGSDMTFWKTLTKNYKQFYVAAISCDERVLVAGDYTDSSVPTDYSPAYQFNITEPPHEIEGSSYTSGWRMQLEVTLGGLQMLEWAYVPGILSAVRGSGQST